MPSSSLANRQLELTLPLALPSWSLVTRNETAAWLIGKGRQVPAELGVVRRKLFLPVQLIQLLRSGGKAVAKKIDGLLYPVLDHFRFRVKQKYALK